MTNASMFVQLQLFIRVYFIILSKFQSRCSGNLSFIHVVTQGIHTQSTSFESLFTLIKSCCIFFLFLTRSFTGKTFIISIMRHHTFYCHLISPLFKQLCFFLFCVIGAGVECAVSSKVWDKMTSSETTVAI